MKVSVIIPVYNAEQYVAEAISSVLNQTHRHLEVLVVDDGSTDCSADVIREFSDSRLQYFHQPNKGVSAARNTGLKHMTGDFFCFLDADDVMPPDSVSSRLQCFTGPEICFAGGNQDQRTHDLRKTLHYHRAEWSGNPRPGLVRLDSKCFINCGTWLLRNCPEVNYKFRENMTHCEDLTFFFDYSAEGELSTVNKTVQLYRRHDDSAMTNLAKLEKGYRQYIKIVKAEKNISRTLVLQLKIKVFKIMVLSYLAARQYLQIFPALSILIL